MATQEYPLDAFVEDLRAVARKTEEPCTRPDLVDTSTNGISTKLYARKRAPNSSRREPAATSESARSAPA
jgi:hypothetical protein